MANKSLVNEYFDIKLKYNDIAKLLHIQCELKVYVRTIHGLLKSSGIYSVEENAEQT